MNLNPENAQQLFDAGAFVVFSDLPEGTEVGIDGDVNVTRKFSGWKMIPPGLHLITWSIPSTHQNSSGMPIRHAFVRHLSGQETYVLKYSAQEEDMVPNTIDEATGEEIPTILSRDHLRTLDAELAAYPLYRWHGWKALVSWVQDEDVVRLVGRRRKLDSLWESPADDEVVLRGTGSQEGKADSTQEQRPAEQRSEQQEGQLSYASFDLKRSWRKGAVGEEVTIFSRDKSWLLQHVIKQHFGGDCLRLLAQLQLAFVIFINVQNFSSLLAFKRFLILLARSERIFRQAELRDEGGLSLQSIEELYLQLLRTLAAQLQSLPETFFTVDLAGTGMQDFWREELQALCSNLARAHVDTAMPKPNPMSGPMQEAVSHLKRIARERFQWTFDAQDDSDSEDEDLEEGEDAPVIVDVDV